MPCVCYFKTVCRDTCDILLQQANKKSAFKKYNNISEKVFNFVCVTVCHGFCFVALSMLVSTLVNGSCFKCDIEMKFVLYCVT